MTQPVVLKTSAAAVSIIRRTYLLITCCCALVGAAAANGATDTSLTAEPAGDFASTSAREAVSPPALDDDGEGVAEFLRKSDQNAAEAMNQLGIRYARGRGVAKNYGVALKWFRRSALAGYPPAMANLGILYQMGEGRRRNYRKAYAWVRAALAFGVPEADHDATVFMLGMIASHLSPGNAVRAERLAEDIAESVTQQCTVPAGQYTRWTYEASNR